MRAAIEESVRRARAVAANQVPKDCSTPTSPKAPAWPNAGFRLQRVGLYVPGGKAVYPSSVIMNAGAGPGRRRRIAGHRHPAAPATMRKVCPNKTILATCAILGVDEVYAVGGAQAIAMFAYGAKGSEPQDGDILCDPVDKITGPGNIFVATAKSHGLAHSWASTRCAGPTEIGIISRRNAPTRAWLAADLIGQAEHDELAGSVLFTDSDRDCRTRCRRTSSTACRVPSTPSASTRRCPAPSLPSC